MNKYEYFTNTYSFDTTVTAVTETEGKYELILEESYFYPESGGQLPDKGTINGLDVITVQERNGKIVHVVS